MGARITVIIPTLNRAGDLRKCIEALEAQTMARGDFEVMVVDGGSEDGTLRLLEEKEAAGGIRLGHLVERRKGAGVARNSGIEASSSEFVAFTDDDCVPEPVWLSALLAGFPDDRRCAGVGGPIVPANPGNVINRYCMHCRNWKDISFGGRTMHIPTMNVLYRRSALLDVGGFEGGVIIGEDIHLSQKIAKRGYYQKSIGAGKVVHKDPATLGELYHKAWLHGTGIAEVGRIFGKRMKSGSLSLLAELLFRKDYAGRISGTVKLTPGDSIAFGLLHRLWIIGVHRGYAHRMKDYISSR